MTHALRFALVLTAFLVSTSVAAALPITIDDFQDGTTMGWGVPGPIPVPPVHVPNGGPGGGGDGYLQLSASGQNAPGGRLSVLNDAQWTGDFLAAGITSIEMDVFNFGPDDLTLRLLFEDFDELGPPGPPINLALTLANVFVPAQSGWMKVVFDLSPANLQALLGTVDGALTDVDVMRIFHNPDPNFPGPGAGIPPVNTVLGIDNIAADNIDAIPEPTSTALLVLGVAAFVRHRRHHRR